jgi:hypothetical protein
VKFFFPDAQDLVDPSFDFAAETRAEHRLRHRDDQYAHEVFPVPPYDGVLVSRAIVEGRAGESGRYTLAQRHRLLRVGAREFFRIGDRPLVTMGDCGAFSYVRDKLPPVSVEEAIDFYAACGFDFGVSIDHIILAYQPNLDRSLPGMDTVPEDWRSRQAVTLELAADFLARHAARKCRFEPVGAAQGWSPASYARCVRDLQQLGYKTIGLGGMVPLKSQEIVEVLTAVSAVRDPKTRLHLFGVSRCEHVSTFAAHGVTSFDSTSPLRQAFMDDRDNYYALDRTYTAVRIPQVEGNAKLQKRIRAGQVNQREARRLERACLDGASTFAETGRGLKSVLAVLREYQALHDARKDRTSEYRETLADRPWAACPCAVCKALGIHVVLFRGAERNRRRGFHNLFVTYHRLQGKLRRRATQPLPSGARRKTPK